MSRHSPHLATPRRPMHRHYSRQRFSMLPAEQPILSIRLACPNLAAHGRPLRARWTHRPTSEQKPPTLHRSLRRSLPRALQPLPRHPAQYRQSHFAEPVPGRPVPPQSRS